MALRFSTRRWQDQLILLLGIWLFVSPMALGYPGSSPVAINGFVAGLIMAALAIFDLYKTYIWAVLLNLIVGIWTAVSPWLINVQDRRMTASLLIVGIATVVLALWEMRTDPELHAQWVGTGTAS
ncbi:SPW repeat protein [Massilia agilis]|uniref:SPW repeat protein n=2 Tax=Massilia TaxID=149698 RepID=A0ABT2BPL0_9BURK|nr:MULTISPECIES: SPW repeat protein [Massilia]MCS0610453.1 SPW repeat protein [Massilia solisilvae]MCS0810760.1 SPW repeat protein [Massilia agilis]